jgi:hypothetical protein
MSMSYSRTLRDSNSRPRLQFSTVFLSAFFTCGRSTLKTQRYAYFSATFILIFQSCFSVTSLHFLRLSVSVLDTANQTARVLGEQSYNQITQFITSEDLDLPNFEAAASPMATSAAPLVAAANADVIAVSASYVAAASASDADAVAADAGGGHSASTGHADAARSQPDRAAAATGIDGGSAEAKHDDHPDGAASNDTPVAPAPTIFVFVPSPAPESVEPVAPSEAASAAVEVSSVASTSVTVPSSIANKSQGMERATLLDKNPQGRLLRFMYRMFPIAPQPLPCLPL